MNARDFAWRQLATARLPGWQFDSNSFRPKQAEPPADSRDLDLAHALTRSVTKHLDHLRHLMQHYSGRTQQQIDPSVQIVICLGLSQLRFFDRLPPYAVVDEAVNQAKRLGFGKAGGFVNAVLRRALREPNPPLPKPNDAQEYARAVLSHPPVLFNRMVKLLGTDSALRLAAKDNTEAPLIVRGTPPAMDEVTVTPHEVPGFSVVTGANEAVLSEWAKAGIAQAQDPTSATVIERMELASAKRVLDRCCGVGTKTMQIAAGAPQAEVVAIDPARFRIEALQHSLSARDLKNTKTAVGKEVPDGEPPFDRILIDVPCSNSGVLIRRPEARYRQDDGTMRSLEKLQRTILADTVSHLQPGGMLVYSTCSIWPEENEDQVRWLTEKFPKLKVVEMQTTLPELSEDPTKHHDGGFFAVLKSESP
ncbi:MAG TPA: transcription antitermination factor NusB [Tepidisphaeraceae bacterium]|jgi:16S rRNA (cytosine967-C5)-methyltransferase